MFSHRPLLERCGWHGEGPGLDELLEGMIDGELMGESYPIIGKEGIEFLKALRKTNKGTNENIDFEWTFGLDEYMAVFNKT